MSDAKPGSEPFIDADAKRAVRDHENAKKAEQRERDRRYRRCFWTWPWGHKWNREAVYPQLGRATWRCVGCGKQVDQWDKP